MQYPPNTTPPPKARARARSPDECVNVPKSGGPLGTITKLQAIQENSGFDAISERAKRYALRDLACKWLTKKERRFNQDKPDGYDTFVHRVNYCKKRRIDKTKDVFVYYNEARGKAHFGNLVTCGSVWTCADCAPRITEGRKTEVKQGIDNWRAKGGHVYLLTLTNRHHRGDDLQQLLKGQQDAMTRLWGHRAVKDMMKLLGSVGRIVATEVLHSDANGWHPHFHILVFFDRELVNGGQGLQSFLAKHWINACAKSGLKLPTMDHGVDLRDGTYADKYVSKWGLESEVTKGHIKKGSAGGMTPFDLLRNSVDQPRYGFLFSEFADAFKGKHQLFWTKGLKELLGVVTKSDEEHAQETDDASQRLDDLAYDVFMLITVRQLQAEFLRLIELDFLDNGARASLFVMDVVNDEIRLMNERYNL